MLKDSVRTLSYKNAILKNKHLFKNKIVLDVGCGTAILSMFAADAGAKHVYGVDMSNIIEQATKIVADNNLSDKITLIKGKIEEITLPVDKVDIIISEWMGYFLLYESMLDTVLVARDKWLAPGGLVFPDKAVMYIAAIEDGQYREEKIDFWDDVYGYKMSSIKQAALHEPLVDTVDDKARCTHWSAFKEIDILTVTKDDLAFKAPFSIQALRNDYVHAFVTWFDISFSCCHKPVHFSTGPHARYTHWKHTIFYTKEAMMVEQGDVIDGEIMCAPNASNPRDLDIVIQYHHKGSVDETNETIQYKM